MMVEWKPTASLDVLRKRSLMIQSLRELFYANGYWEVETPIVSQETVIDAHLDPMTYRDSRNEQRFLQTSPEAAMKRLLSAGADRIFQISRTFREGETGRLHNTEFSMLEWYALGQSHTDQMHWVEQLVKKVVGGFQPKFKSTRFLSWSYDEAFEKAIGQKILGCDTGQLMEIAKNHNVTVPDGMNSAYLDDWRNLLLSAVVEPRIKKEQAVFIYDYPASQAALARVRNETPPVAERFELYINGIEICNGYNELTDAAELRQRCRDQNQQRTRLGKDDLPIPIRLLASMDAGLPTCSGVALGIDRLVMVALQLEDIAEVIPFPYDRA